MRVAAKAGDQATNADTSERANQIAAAHIDPRRGALQLAASSSGGLRSARPRDERVPQKPTDAACADLNRLANCARRSITAAAGATD